MKKKVEHKVVIICTSAHSVNEYLGKGWLVKDMKPVAGATNNPFCYVLLEREVVTTENKNKL